MDMLVWTVTHAGRTAQVSENGRVDGDAELVTILQAKLAEPVTVFRQGTVRNRGHGGEITLKPGDGRYVVARIRSLCAEGGEFTIAGCDWR